MLETTFATPFVPGANLKGQVAGANWIFLRPNLLAEQVICIGTPAMTTLTTLASFSQTLTVVGTRMQQGEAPHVASQQSSLPNIHSLLMGEDGMLPFPSKSVDLVLIVGGRNLWRLRRDQRLQAELWRLLKPDGLLYYEYWGLFDPLQNGNVLNQTNGATLIGQQLWLTPLNGEMHTAVPVVDQAAIDYFRRHDLYSPSFKLDTLKQVWQQAAERPAKPPLSAPDGLHGQRSSDRSKPLAKRRRLPPIRAGAMIRRWIVRLSKLLDEQPLFDRLVGRRGVLLSTSPTVLAHHPPQYIQTIAAAAGVQLDHLRWGLAARGEYSSRKLLFFLFDGTHDAPDAPPTYLVKMVRHPIFNARLENEQRALALLSQQDIGDRETLPQVLFFGHHANLAIVGETMLKGVPFRQRTDATAECPYLQAALDWLTRLSEVTADPTVVAPGEAAQQVEKLATRCFEIYQFTAEQQSFLLKQIATLAASQTPLPLVFQHGDPGTWNMLVTPTGRVALLDWEAAEPQGMPLWDLFYFLRSYCVEAARTSGIHDSLRGFTDQFLGETPLGCRVHEAIRFYCTRIGLSYQLVEPLFYTCWLHRALKEATRLTPNNLESGHYVNLLRLTIAQRHTPSFHRLFDLRSS